jgi:hypothetical protein
MNYDFDYYTGTYLERPKKPTRPALGRDASSLEARAYADALGDYEKSLEAYKQENDYYNKQCKDLIAEFYRQVKIDHSLGDAEFDLIWGEAYSRAHSGGLEETYNEFLELRDFYQRCASVMLMK